MLTLISPFWVVLWTPSSPPSVSQQTGRARGRLSCRSRPIMWKRWHIFWKRGRFRSGKHKQRCFNMMVAGGAERKVKEGNKGEENSSTYSTNPSNGSLECWRLFLEPGCRRDPTEMIYFLFYWTSSLPAFPFSDLCSRASPLFLCRDGSTLF